MTYVFRPGGVCGELKNITMLLWFIYFWAEDPGGNKVSRKTPWISTNKVYLFPKFQL